MTTPSMDATPGTVGEPHALSATPMTSAKIIVGAVTISADGITLTPGADVDDAAREFVEACQRTWFPQAATVTVDDAAVDEAAVAEVLRAHRLAGPRYTPEGTPGLSNPYPYANGYWRCACGVGDVNGYENHGRHVVAVLAATVPTSPTERCTTPGCDGDWRYAAPGRGHIDGCHHPLPTSPTVTGGADDGLREALRELICDGEQRTGQSVADRTGRAWASLLGDLVAAHPESTAASDNTIHFHDPDDDNVCDAERDTLRAELDAARARIARVEALADEAIHRAESSLSRTFDGHPFTAIVDGHALRTALAGDDA